ncbi:MAG TPA: RHS repeat domain-containing protein [Candidatus Binatia bacterium]|nr:RHS repeat domain-containing protein [Candidatus Binatia bacterium]
MTIYTCDALIRLTQGLDPLNGTTGFTYDANGNLLCVTDAQSNATTYTYDTCIGARRSRRETFRKS